MNDDLGLDSGRNDLITLPDGSILTTHGPVRCAGDTCCIHRPSEHPLNRAPLRWVPDLYLMFRTCQHGGQEHLHPDPDSLEFRQLLVLAGRQDPYDGWHPCCPQRCCQVGDDADD